MLDGYLRPKLDKVLLEPLLSFPIFQRVHPILLTFCGLVLGVLVVPLYAYPCLAVLCLVLSGLLDMMDGSLARKRGLASPKGAALDIVADRVVEGAVVFSLFFVAPEERALDCLWMLVAILFCVTTFLVTAIFMDEESEKSFYYSPGLMERGEAFVFFALLLLVPSWFFVLSRLFTVLVLFTGCQRLFRFYRL